MARPRISATAPAGAVATALAAAFAGGCVAPPPLAAVTAAEVAALLEAQRRAWNDGDLEAFMAGYRRDEELTFVGASGLTRGFAATLANYRRAYPDAAARGELAFELVEVRDLGGAAGLAIGRWRLIRGESVSGWFTLVLQRLPQGLVIVHDHSS